MLSRSVAAPAKESSRVVHENALVPCFRELRRHLGYIVAIPVWVVGGKADLLIETAEGLQELDDLTARCEVIKGLTRHPNMAATSPIVRSVTASGLVGRRQVSLAMSPAIPFLSNGWRYPAVPRYLEFVVSIARSAALRPDKNPLRERGITASAWDREAAGIRLKRERL
jgi:hypothetical protein